METLMQPMQPVLETLRLNLRPFEAPDAGLVSMYASDYRVAKMTTQIPHPYPPGAAEQFIAASRNGSYGLVWAIDGTPGFGSPVIGAVSLGSDGEIGYWIAPFFWGLGIATEAAKSVVGYARSRGDAKVWAGAFEDNPASQNVLQKAGLARSDERTMFSVARDENVRSLVFERRFRDD